MGRKVRGEGGEGGVLVVGERGGGRRLRAAGGRGVGQGRTDKAHRRGERGAQSGAAVLAAWGRGVAAAVREAECMQGRRRRARDGVAWGAAEQSKMGSRQAQGEKQASTGGSRQPPCLRCARAPSCAAPPGCGPGPAAVQGRYGGGTRWGGCDACRRRRMSKRRRSKLQARRRRQGLAGAGRQAGRRAGGGSSRARARLGSSSGSGSGSGGGPQQGAAAGPAPASS